MRLSRLMSFVAALIAAAFCAVALDLPTKTLKGTKYYYYKVKKHETVYGISKKLGLTREEIIAENPSADDGVKKGMVLYFPYDKYSPEAEEEMAAIDTNELVPVDTVVEISRPSIALLLPFGLGKEEPSRDNRLALDFYKGFLMAADTLADRAGDLDIYALDSDVDSIRIRELLDSDAVKKSAVIVAPNDENVYKAIAAEAAVNGNFVLNTFIVADSLYLTNSQVLQANIPHTGMYRLAVDAFESEFDGFTPVIIRSNTGRNEKDAFVAYFINRCNARGVEPVVINYESNLVSADLDKLDFSPGRKYVILPSSGSLAEFNKFAYVVKAMRDRIASAPTAEGEVIEHARLEIFGYPDWTAFRGEALDILHKLGAMVYSRFYDDFESFNSRTFNTDFKRWFGTPVIESIPSQAFLGYDTGCYLIRNLTANDGVFDPLAPRSYTGIQSTFDFDRINGYANCALYIIKYLPDGSTSARVI